MCPKIRGFGVIFWKVRSGCLNGGRYARSRCQTKAFDVENIILKCNEVYVVVGWVIGGVVCMVVG